MFIIFYMVLAASFTTITVSYNALIADKSHPLQRGETFKNIVVEFDQNWVDLDLIGFTGKLMLYLFLIF